MKQCPFCAEQIQDAAVKCKHCGSTVEGSSGPSAADTLDRAATRFAEEIYEGKLLGERYRIEHRLGSGGMGEVWRAVDTELDDMPVAVKVLPAVLAHNPHSIKSLKREAAIALKLTHPNICRLHNFHSDGNLKFLVMEHLEGQTLEESLDGKTDRRMTLDELLPIARDVAEALDHAHAQSPPVLHRDIKPSNIMVTPDGHAKLLDFGIARELKDSMTRVTGQDTSGTLLYMSPEQFSGKLPTPASDVYSLAATLYECLAGHPPFYQGSIGHQLLNMPPPEIAGVPHHVSVAIQKGLSKDGAARPATAYEFVSLLNASPLKRATGEENRVPTVEPVERIPGEVPKSESSAQIEIDPRVSNFHAGTQITAVPTTKSRWRTVDTVITMVIMLSIPPLSFFGFRFWSEGAMVAMLLGLIYLAIESTRLASPAFGALLGAVVGAIIIMPASPLGVIWWWDASSAAVGLGCAVGFFLSGIAWVVARRHRSGVPSSAVAIVPSQASLFSKMCSILLLILAIGSPFIRPVSLALTHVARLTAALDAEYYVGVMDEAADREPDASLGTMYYRGDGTFAGKIDRGTAVMCYTTLVLQTASALRDLEDRLEKDGKANVKFSDWSPRRKIDNVQSTTFRSFDGVTTTIEVVDARVATTSQLENLWGGPVVDFVIAGLALVACLRIINARLVHLGHRRNTVK